MNLDLYDKSNKHLFTERTVLSAHLSWAIYNEGLKQLDLTRSGQSANLWANNLSFMIKRNKVRILQDEILHTFCVPTEHPLRTKDGIVSIDDHNKCGFVETTNEDGGKTLNIVFRGTELCGTTLRSVRKYIFHDFMRVGRHYDELRPIVNNAIEYARRNQMNVHFTGHSLGAAMAQIAMAEHPAPEFSAIVFGSPGDTHVLEGAMQAAEAFFKRLDRVAPGLPRFKVIRRALSRFTYDLSSITVTLGVGISRLATHLTGLAIDKVKLVAGQSGDQDVTNGKSDDRIISFVNQRDFIPFVGTLVNKRNMDYSFDDENVVDSYFGLGVKHHEMHEYLKMVNINHHITHMEQYTPGAQHRTEECSKLGNFN